MINHARSFVTMKMRKRAQIREVKVQNKSMLKLKKLLGNKIGEQMQNLEDDDEIEEPKEKK